MVTLNDTWLDNLLKNNGYSNQFLLIKVVNTVLKQNSFKSLLTWTSTALSGFDNLKGIEDNCDKQDDLFFLDSISKLFDESYGKYDLIIIESKMLFQDEEITKQEHDEVLTKIINNHLTKEGKLIILDEENLISGFPDQSNPYSDFGDFRCNDFRLENSNKLEASIAIDYNSSILILNRTESEQTLIYNFQIEKSIIYFDFVYSNKALKYWINFNPIFLSDELITQHVEWASYFLLNNHLSLNSQNVNENDHSDYWYDLNIIDLGKDFWDSNLYGYFDFDNSRYSNRNELNLFHEYFNNLVHLKNISSQKKSILTSYFSSNYFNENNIILKNTFIKLKSKLNINDFDFSLIFFENYKEICFSFLEELNFKDDFEESFTYLSENQFNVIAVDYENDFVNKNEAVLSNLLLSLTDSNKEAEFDIFILVNIDILSSEKYENFRKEFTHYLYSLVKVGNEFMLWFKGNFVDKVFISFDDIKDPRLLKLKYNNIFNFSTKQDHFYKNWIDTNNLSNITNDEKIDKLLKGQEEIKLDTTQIKSDTTEIKANIKSMMSEVREIKSLTEDNIESIDNSISLILDSVEKNYDFNDIDKYINKVTQWFNYWDKIENNTKTFMPGSELLYDNIKNSVFEDFSPFILYYCRALENELLNKIFLKFHTYFNSIPIEKQEILFNWNKDGLSEKKLKQYKQTFDGLNSNIKNNKHTLGSMRFILSIIPNAKKKNGSERYQRSPLLKEFYIFTKKEFGDFDPKTVKQLENIITNYRNKSAHVDIINEENALVFYEDLKELMNKLIEKL